MGVREAMSCMRGGRYLRASCTWGRVRWWGNGVQGLGRRGHELREGGGGGRRVKGGRGWA
jgi:hypothetical protein